MDLADDSSTIFSMSVAVQFAFISTGVVISYLDALNVPVALWVAGCEADAMEYLTSQSKRDLQDEGTLGTVEYSQVEPWVLDGSCVPGGEDITCQIFGSRINTYVDGTIAAADLRSRITRAVDMFSTLVTDQMGVLAMRVEDIELEEDGIDTGIIGGDESDPDGGKETRVVIGSVAAGLAMFFITILCVLIMQRRPDAAVLSRSRFEDEAPYTDVSRSFDPQIISSDSDVYLKEDDNESRDYDQSYGYDGYETRVIPLEENTESATADVSNVGTTATGWSPYTASSHVLEYHDYTSADDSGDADDIFWVNHPRHRDHECSAATCEICESRRQQGVGDKEYDTNERIQASLSPERIPSSDSQRQWLVEDTVEL